MEFSKETLQNLVWGDFDSDHYEVIYDNVEDSSRWSIQHEMVFKYDGKFYQTSYRVGATEYQDEQPYENDNDEIECHEVEPYEVTVTKYRKVK